VSLFVAFVITLSMACGPLFSGALVFYGYCQGVFLNYSLDGVTGWGRIILRSGTWFHLAFSGLYGENGIIVLLRMRSTQSLSFMNYSLILCMIGLQFGAIPAPILSFLS
jgi:hypothetical protein